MEQTRSLFCMCDSGVARYQSQHQCFFLENEFDVRSVLHRQMSLVALNQIQICVIHEAMNGCKNLKIHKRLASKM